MTSSEIVIWNEAVKATLLEAAKIPTPSIQNCITYYQIEILQLEKKLKR